MLEVDWRTMVYCAHAEFIYCDSCRRVAQINAARSLSHSAHIGMQQSIVGGGHQQWLQSFAGGGHPVSAEFGNGS
jgi:hypothetical protein